MTGANLTATAGPIAVNGTSTHFMPSDAAPAIQLGTNTIPGLVRGDGATFSVVGGSVHPLAALPQALLLG